MELDDLKKSWSMLDKQLQKEDIVNEKQISELIAKYQANAKKELNKIQDFQKTSLIAGVSFLLFMAIVIMVDTSFFRELKFTAKVISMAIFALLTIIFGFWWDIKTYRFSRNTKVAEMSTVEVMERMNTFRKWAILEFRIIPFWALAFFGLFFWLRDYHTQPLVSQLAFFCFTVVVITLTMVFVYKKMFKHLNEIKKNLEELKELENEN